MDAENTNQSSDSNVDSSKLCITNFHAQKFRKSRNEYERAKKEKVRRREEHSQLPVFLIAYFAYTEARWTDRTFVD